MRDWRCDLIQIRKRCIHPIWVCIVVVSGNTIETCDALVESPTWKQLDNFGNVQSDLRIEEKNTAGLGGFAKEIGAGRDCQIVVESQPRGNSASCR